MRIWQVAIGAVVAIIVVAAAQDVKHAPSLTSCVGDINLWSSQLPGFPNPSSDQMRSGLKSMPLRELDGRTSSLTDCVNAYPALGKGQNGDMSAAVTLSFYYGLETQTRYMDFIFRHGMLKKFNEEDEAGER
jgi:hypothetical protein